MTNKQLYVAKMRELAKVNKQLNEDRKKMTKAHEKYIKDDIIQIYSAMCVVLWNNGMDDADLLEDLIMRIQEEWTYHVQERAPKTRQTMADYCAELTGIDIRTSVE